MKIRESDFTPILDNLGFFSYSITVEKQKENGKRKTTKRSEGEKGRGRQWKRGLFEQK